MGSWDRVSPRRGADRAGSLGGTDLYAAGLPAGHAYALRRRHAYACHHTYCRRHVYTYLHTHRFYSYPNPPALPDSRRDPAAFANVINTERCSDPRLGPTPRSIVVSSAL